MRASESENAMAPDADRTRRGRLLMRARLEGSGSFPVAIMCTRAALVSVEAGGARGRGSGGGTRDASVRCRLAPGGRTPR